MHLLLQEYIYAEIDISDYRREMGSRNEHITLKYPSNYIMIGKYIVIIALHSTLYFMPNGVLFRNSIKLETHPSIMKSSSKYS